MLPRKPDKAAAVLDRCYWSDGRTITDNRGAIQHLRSEMGDGDLGQRGSLGRAKSWHDCMLAMDVHRSFRSTVEGERKERLDVHSRATKSTRIARELFAETPFQHAGKRAGSKLRSGTTIAGVSPARTR